MRQLLSKMFDKTRVMCQSFLFFFRDSSVGRRTQIFEKEKKEACAEHTTNLRRRGGNLWMVGDVVRSTGH